MLLAEVLHQVRGLLQSADISNATLEAQLLAAHVLGLSRVDILMHPEMELSLAQCADIGALADRRASQEPMAYILGYKEFRSLRFEVGPAVLVPRPETELLVEAALDRGGTRVLELGTGSGCISVSIAKENRLAEITAVDISEEALGVARRNAAAHGVDIRFVREDMLLSRLPGVLGGGFDVVVSNPPYISAVDIEALPLCVRGFEPPQALDGGPDGLRFYRAIAGHIPSICAPGASILLEIGHDQAADVSAILEAAGCSSITTKKDMAGLDRMVAARYSLREVLACLKN